MWFVMGEGEITKPVKSLALSCSWHTLAADMSVEKYETIHKAPHTPTLKYYRETFKWKTSNKLQLKCLWQTALSWAPYHRSPRSSASVRKKMGDVSFLWFVDRSSVVVRGENRVGLSVELKRMLLAQTPGWVLRCYSAPQLLQALCCSNFCLNFCLRC